MMSSLRIVSAAIRLEDRRGRLLIISIPKPGRHSDILNHLHAIGYAPSEQNHGFLTNDGQFVNRIAAMRVAVEADQLLPETGDQPRLNALHSENLW